MSRDVDGEEPIAVHLQDLGTGPDRVAGDGLYCAYFTDFLPNSVRQRHLETVAHYPFQGVDKRYSVSYEVEGTNKTKIHHGTRNAKREAT